MKNQLDWQSHVNVLGEFELPAYLYKMINSLMKQSLDLGTLLSNDSGKTRAYKERVKEAFKAQWFLLAEALEYFEIVVPCECFGSNTFCNICGGSRYQLDNSINPTVMREFSFVTTNTDPNLVLKLQAGLEKALLETS